MPRGASPRREREYRKIKRRFEEEGRYQGREAEVASRIVNQQRAQYGETRKARQQERRGENPDRDLPIRRYRHLTAGEVTAKLSRLSSAQLRKVRSYEKSHKDRKTVLRAIERELSH